MEAQSEKENRLLFDSGIHHARMDCGGKTMFNNHNHIAVNTELKKVSDALGVQWAPFDVPMKRRFQTIGATAYVCLVLFGEFFAIYLAIKLLYSEYWFLGILYAAWMINDISICYKGGRKFDWVRNWSWWRYFCDYFPLKLVKTADLDPNKNYLFACFPHGVFGTGAFGAFATNALGFYKLFPGMNFNIITLTGHFSVPFFRDLMLALGGCGSSQESLLHLLNPKKYTGKCVALVVGGAAEALDAHPGEYKLLLNKRKGFVRIAMMAGAPLVPVFSFGELDVFRPLNNPEDSLLRKFQEKVKQLTGISPMFPIGRGMFQYSFGVLPLRCPITTVVGAPMEVKKNLEPTPEEVNVVHAEFTQRLIELFESEKAKYLKSSEDIHLIIS